MNNKGAKLLFVSILSLGIISCGGGGSDSTPEQEPVNQKPTANAGADQNVDEQTAVTIQGSGTDSDGSIASYSWEQTSGPQITLSNTSQQSLEFTAPVAKQATNLEFTLTVTDNDGATGSDIVIVTVSPVDEQKVTLQGVVNDGPIPNAQVTAEVAGKTYTATADVDGNYTLEISEDEDVDFGNELIYITALGGGSQEDIKLISVIDNFSVIVNQAGNDGVLTADENSGVNVTNVSTAFLALVKIENDNLLPRTANELSLISREVDEREISSTSTALRLVAEFSAESVDLELPIGVQNTWDFVNNQDLLLEYIRKAKVEPNIDFYNIALERTLTDPSVVKEYNEIPESYTAYVKPIIGLPVDAENFEFSSNGTGVFKHELGTSDFTWINNNTLNLDFNGSVIDVSTRPFYNGSVYEDAVRHKIFEEIILEKILTTGSVDIVSYTLNWKYHYPNGEYPDEVYSHTDIRKFVKSHLPFNSSEVVGERMLPLAGDFLYTEGVNVTGYGDLEFSQNLKAGNFTFSEDGSVISDIALFDNGRWDLTETGKIKLTFTDYLIEVNKLAEHAVTVTVKDILGNYEGQVTGQSAIRKIADAWGENIEGIYYFHGNLIEPLNYLWLDLKADGTGQRVDVFDSNQDGVLDSSEYRTHPLTWRKENNHLVIERYKDIYNQACESLRNDCFVYSQRYFELYEIDGNKHYIKTRLKFNIWPLVYSTLDPELLNLWISESLQTRYWIKTDISPIQPPSL